MSKLFGVGSKIENNASEFRSESEENPEQDESIKSLLSTKNKDSVEDESTEDKMIDFEYPKFYEQRKAAIFARAIERQKAMNDTQLSGLKLEDELLRMHIQPAKDIEKFRSYLASKQSQRLSKK